MWGPRLTPKRMMEAPLGAIAFRGHLAGAADYRSVSVLPGVIVFCIARALGGSLGVRVALESKLHTVAVVMQASNLNSK